MLKKSKGSRKVHELGLGTYVRGRHHYGHWGLASISGERGGTSWKKTERMSFYLIRFKSVIYQPARHCRGQTILLRVQNRWQVVRILPSHLVVM